MPVRAPKILLALGQTIQQKEKQFKILRHLTSFLMWLHNNL